MEGSQTKVDGNVTDGDGPGYGYGLQTSGQSDRINLLFPLTKEFVSTNNHNGQNYRSWGTIQTVDALEPL